MAVEIQGEAKGGIGGRRTIGGVEEDEKGAGEGERKGVVFMDRLDEADMGVFRRRA